MGGSGPAGQHIHRQLCSRLLQQLGEPFRGSGCPDLRQRRAVLFCSVGRAVLYSGNLSPTHPQANGLVERFHRQLKDALLSRLDNQDWPSHLPWVLLGLRAAPKEDCAISSAEMVYGEPLTLPGDFVDSSTPPPVNFMQQLRDKMSRFQPPPTRPVPVQQVARRPACTKLNLFILGEERRPHPSHPSTLDPIKLFPEERRLSTWTSEAGTRSCQQTD